MKNQEKMMGDMFTIARATVENGVKNMDFFQDQVAKNVDFAMNNMKTAQDRTREIASAWMEQANKIRTSYLNFVDGGLNMLERQFDAGDPPQARAGK